MAACFLGYDAPPITYYRKVDTANMSGDTQPPQNLERSHAAVDDTSDDDQEPISDADLDSCAYYTKGLDVRPFSTMRRLKESIDMLSKRLATGETEEQYYTFTSVPREVVDRIDKDPPLLGRSVRITYFWGERVMIMKLLSSCHEIAHVEFGKLITHAVTLMGVPLNSLVGMASTRMEGRNSSKQADTSYRPRPPRRHRGDWPTIVIEAGYTQSRRSLRNAARWWLSHSNRDVKIVILISIYEHPKEIVIEKWCNRSIIPRRSTRRQQGPRTPVITPSLITTVTVSHIPNTPLDRPNSYNVLGPNLTLEFHELFLRAPVAPEGNISLGQPELQSWAVGIWDSAL